MTDYKSNNQKIAEWLGWKRELFTTPEEGEQLWISPTKTLGELPDFYGSEEASNLIFDKLRRYYPGLFSHLCDEFIRGSIDRKELVVNYGLRAAL